MAIAMGLGIPLPCFIEVNNFNDFNHCHGLKPCFHFIHRIHSFKLSCIIFCSDLAPTLLRPAPTFLVTVTLPQPFSDSAPTSLTYLVTVTMLQPCSNVFSQSVMTVMMLRPYSDIFSHTITILQFQTLTPLILLCSIPLHDPRHHSRFCGQQ